MLPLHRQDLQGPSDDVDVNSFLSSVPVAGLFVFSGTYLAGPGHYWPTLGHRSRGGATLGITSSYLFLSLLKVSCGCDAVIKGRQEN
jgi:hypothetical protein